MSDNPPPPVNPRLLEIRARKAKERELAAAQEKNMAALAENVNRTFVLDGKEFKVVGFEADQLVGSIRGPAYKIEGANPNRHDFILADEFLADYKLKE